MTWAYLSPLNGLWYAASAREAADALDAGYVVRLMAWELL